MFFLEPKKKFRSEKENRTEEKKLSQPHKKLGNKERVVLLKNKGYRRSLSKTKKDTLKETPAIINPKENWCIF